MKSGSNLEELNKELKELRLENNKLKATIKQNQVKAEESDDFQISTDPSSRNFQIFFNTISDFLFVLDEKGFVIEANQTVYDRLGYTPEELKGKSVLLVHPQERRQEAGRIVGEMLMGTAEFCPIPLITKSGKYIPVETRVSKGVWNGKTAVFGVSKDISEIRLSEEKFSKAFNNSLQISAISDAETGVYIDVNKTFCETLGFRREELIGKSSAELNILPSDVRKNILSRYEGKEGFANVEVPFLKKSGERIFTLFSAEFIYVQDKKYLYTTALDITENKKVQAEFLASELKLRSVFDIIGVGISLTDEAGSILECNSACENMLKVPREELLGSTYIVRGCEFLHPDLSPMKKESSAAYLALKQNRAIRGLQEGVRLSDGSLKWLSVNAEPLDLPGYGVIISYVDITSRVEAEKALMENEELYRTVTENITDVIWILSLNENRFTYISPSVYQLRGFTAEEAMAQTFQESITPGHVDQIIELFYPYLQDFLNNPKKKQHHTHELQQKCKDGRDVWVEIITQFQFSKKGDVEILGVTRDIEKRKQAELALKDSEARLKLSIDAANEGTWDWNLQTDEVTYNAKWAEMLGYELSEIEKTYEMWQSHIHPDDCDKVKKALDKHFKGKIESYKVEYRLRSKNGDWRWVEDVGRVIEWAENGQPSRAIGLHYDLTKQKEIQQKLAELNATKDKFFSIIAHDLKNPFGAILGFSGLIDEECLKTGNEIIKEYNGYVLQSAKAGYELLVNLLDWSRLQNGKIRFCPEDFDLSTSVKSLYSSFIAPLNGKDLKLQILVPSPFMINADLLMMETVLRNMISNAIKFTPVGGKITIDAKNLDDRVEIRVSDTGVGISSDKVNRLFKIEESFTTVGTNEETGTGLGLVLCNDFVKQHRGNIVVESKVNAGTTFVITIPK